MNINELKAAREDLRLNVFEPHTNMYGEKFEICNSFQVYEDTIKTIIALLDQAIERSESATAINAPDLESLKREASEFVLERCSVYKDLPIGLMIDTSIELIDHLAPRIVREGFVVVPEVSTDEIIEAMYKVVNRETLVQPIDINGLYQSVYKAMIAASKGD
jgi:hypothetical protein